MMFLEETRECAYFFCSCIRMNAACITGRHSPGISWRLRVLLLLQNRRRYGRKRRDFHAPGHQRAINHFTDRDADSPVGYIVRVCIEFHADRCLLPGIVVGDNAVPRTVGQVGEYTLDLANATIESGHAMLDLVLQGRSNTSGFPCMC